MHPLKTTPPSVAFPILCCCMKMCKNANEVGELTPEEEQKLRDDIKEQTQRLDTVTHFYKAPAYKGTSFSKEKLRAAGLTKGTTSSTTIEDLGFGILAWLGLLKFLFFVYIVITVFALTMMSNYSSYGLLDPSGGLSGFKSIGKTSMGSIGFQQNICIFQFLGMSGNGASEITCDKGLIDGIVHHGARAKISDEEKLSLGLGDDWCGASTALNPKDSKKNFDCTAAYGTALTD